MEVLGKVDPIAEAKEVEWDPDGRWWVGRINRWSGVTSDYSLPARVKVMDSTLREGEEVPGTKLNVAQKVELAHRLVEAGFSELEVGYAGVIQEHALLVKSLHQEGLPIEIASHTRIYGQTNEWRDEIDRNIDSGVDILTFVGFASEVGAASTPWLAKDAVPDRVAACCAYARERGATVTFGLGDLVRTQLQYIVTCYQLAAEAGADRLYVYDGMGAATPAAISYLTKLIRDIGGPTPEIGVHVHNTFGLATANAIEAVTAGASVVDAVPLGLGDGAGITASEELVGALEVLYGVSTGIELSRLTPLCRHIAEVFGLVMPETKALVGANQFIHSIDSHVAAIIRGAWHAWEVVRPDVVGQEREVQFGHAKLRQGRSGALFAKAQQLGFDPDLDTMNEILEKVRTITEEQSYATEKMVEEVIQEVHRGSQYRKRTQNEG